MTNPYAVSASKNRIGESVAGDSTADPVAQPFDATITVEDFKRMMPEQWAVRVLAVLVLGILIPGLAIIVVITVSVAVTSRVPIEGLVGSLMMSLVILAFAWALFWCSTGQRLRRALTAHPDLIGPVRGVITPEGFRYHDGVKTHWFDAGFVHDMFINGKGVRVKLSDEPYHFLALTRRMFDDFNVNELRMIRQQALARSGTGDDPDVDMQFVIMKLGDPLPDAIDYGGEVRLDVPYAQSGQPKQLAIQAITTIGLLIGAIFSAVTGSFWWPLGLFVFAIVNFVSQIELWRMWLGKKNITLSWVQRGWISPDELVWAAPRTGLRVGRRGLKPIHVDEHLVVCTAGQSTQLYFSSSHFESPEDWQRIKDWLVDAEERNRSC